MDKKFSSKWNEKNITELLENLEFIYDHRLEKFSDIFLYNKFISTGSFGIVILVFEKRTNEFISIKIIEKFALSEANLIKTIENSKKMKNLHHKNIIEYKFVCDSDHYQLIGSEYLEGGTLTQFLDKRKTGLSDIEASDIMKQIFEALIYLHMNNIIHRDLKPDNIMFKYINDISSLKLIDFGLGAKLSRGFESYASECCGTIQFMAPELIEQKHYFHFVDLWASGVILYFLLTFKYPFHITEDILHDFNKSIFAKIFFPKDVNKFAQDLIQKLCAYDPLNRYTAVEAISHPFISKNYDDPIQPTILESLILEDCAVHIKIASIILVLLAHIAKTNQKINKTLKINIMESNKEYNDEEQKLISLTVTASKKKFRLPKLKLNVNENTPKNDLISKYSKINLKSPKPPPIHIDTPDNIDRKIHHIVNMIEVKNQRMNRKILTFSTSKQPQIKFDWLKVSQDKKTNEMISHTETNLNKNFKYGNTKLFQTPNSKLNYNFSLFALQRIKEEKNILPPEKRSSQFKRSSQKKLEPIGFKRFNTILDK